MQFRAVIKRSGDWWIGWLVDLPGVNAQEKTRAKLLESLRIGAEDMLNTPFETKEEEEMVPILADLTAAFCSRERIQRPAPRLRAT